MLLGVTNVRTERIDRDKKIFKYWLKQLLSGLKPRGRNWFAINIGYNNGVVRVITPFDTNKRPRQYQSWSGKKLKEYPVYTGVPRFLIKKK